MSVNYKLIKNHSKSAEKAEYRAVTVENQMVGLERIGRNIQEATTLTRADVIGTIAALKDEIADQLMSGNGVHLPGIGYFSLAVKGNVYEDPRTHRHRLRNAEVRTVKFRPDIEMLDTLQHTKFENVTYRHGTSSVPTAELTDKALIYSPLNLSSRLPTCAITSTFPLPMPTVLLPDWNRKASSAMSVHATARRMCEEKAKANRGS